jgi:hypothetical protein
LKVQSRKFLHRFLVQAATGEELKATLSGTKWLPWLKAATGEELKATASKP